MNDRKARVSSPLDSLSYEAHTGRELSLMLDGTKPFAAFSGQYPPSLDIEEIPERLFDPYVAAGIFVKGEHIISGRNDRKALRLVLYAARNHEWRINAYILLYETAAKTGWSEGFERLQGTLLGYSDWQNDEYIEKVYNSLKTR
jgi:hypothetical protein